MPTLFSSLHFFCPSLKGSATVISQELALRGCVAQCAWVH